MMNILVERPGGFVSEQRPRASGKEGTQMSRCDRFAGTIGGVSRSRLSTGAVLAMVLLVVAGHYGQRASASGGFGAAYDGITGKQKYRYSSWGILVKDLLTGEVLFSRDAAHRFVPGSTVKSFTSLAAMDALGAGHRFETPVYAVGPIGPDGRVEGDLVLVAQGDPTLGGRTKPDGTIDFTNMDHGDANSLGGSGLTPEDPLAGVDELARQVAASGVRSARDVIVDDRLFEDPDLGKEFPLSPILINDNLIDLVVKATQPGQRASVTWRPRSAAYRVISEVRTVAEDETDIAVSSLEPGVIEIRGAIAAADRSTVRTFTVKDPPAFARTCFVEALARHGVAVDAPATGPNPRERLPIGETFSGTSPVALFTSPPFSEDVKLTLKVSQNIHADTYVLLTAAAAGERTFYEGLSKERESFRAMGIDLDALCIGDGAGGTSNDRISPKAAVQLLTAASRRSDFTAFFNALPILGVDGSLADSATPGSKAIGKVRAKTGTTADYDPLNDRGLLLGKGLAGYVDAASGRRLVFAVYVNNAPYQDIDGIMDVGRDLARLTEAMHANF
ncbi:MAG: D-alanyl-D-alanine carboxypeptidase/D-alanyl-D-alanine-endopeptidase [Acidobacteriota bacterium]